MPYYYYLSTSNVTDAKPFPELFHSQIEVAEWLPKFSSTAIHSFTRIINDFVFSSIKNPFNGCKTALFHPKYETKKVYESVPEVDEKCIDSSELMGVLSSYLLQLANSNIVNNIILAKILVHSTMI